jgi:hypothetical protein
MGVGAMLRRGQPFFGWILPDPAVAAQSNRKARPFTSPLSNSLTLSGTPTRAGRLAYMGRVRLSVHWFGCRDASLTST